MNKLKKAGKVLAVRRRGLDVSSNCVYRPWVWLPTRRRRPGVVTKRRTSFSVSARATLTPSSAICVLRIGQRSVSYPVSCRAGLAKAWYLDVFDKYGQTPTAAAAEMGLLEHAK